MSAATDRVARLPWVTRLETTQDCDSYRWGRMPGKALGNMYLMSRYKCRSRARWQFRALPGGPGNPLPAADGTYCWSHLWALGLQHGMAEVARTAEALARFREEDVRPGMIRGFL